MLYTDRIYGKVEINEPVLIELINSPVIQRLKEIDQAGYPEPFIKGLHHTRFEHSMGVFILLKRYHAPLEEQIAGLIHDVSHSAFSHCIDYALDEESEKTHKTQDDVFKPFVLKSEIINILNKYKLDPEYILNENNFPLKETTLPDICADRIDYSLRTAFIAKEIDKKELSYILNNLTVMHQKWVFKDSISAKKYTDLFLKLNAVYYSGLLSAVMFRTVGDYLKYALNKGYINEYDLYTTDQFVLDKINIYLSHDRIQDNKLKLLWDRMNNKVEYILNDKDYNARVFVKSRAVDPMLIDNGKIKRYSQLKTFWKKVIEQESSPKEYFIKFAK